MEEFDLGVITTGLLGIRQIEIDAANTPQKVKQLVSNVAKRATADMTRSQKIFTQQIADLDNTTKTAVANGRMEIVDAAVIARANIGTSGIVDVITAATQRIQGISSFQGLLLQRDQQILGIRVGYGENASTSANAGVIDYQFDQTVPNALKNAELVISQNDSVIYRLPMSAFFCHVDGFSVRDSWYFVEAPKVLKANISTTIQVYYPTGATFTPNTANNFPFLNVEFKTNELRPRSNNPA